MLYVGVHGVPPSCCLWLWMDGWMDRQIRQIDRYYLKHLGEMLSIRTCMIYVFITIYIYTYVCVCIARYVFFIHPYISLYIYIHILGHTPVHGSKWTETLMGCEMGGDGGEDDALCKADGDGGGNGGLFDLINLINFKTSPIWQNMTIKGWGWNQNQMVGLWHVYICYIYNIYIYVCVCMRVSITLYTPLNEEPWWVHGKKQ